MHFYRPPLNQARYGTFVNGQRQDQCNLQNGDVISLVDENSVPENVKHMFTATHLSFQVVKQSIRNTDVLMEIETIFIDDDDDNEDDNQKDNGGEKLVVDKSSSPIEKVISKDDYEEGEPSNVDPSSVRQSTVERGPVAKVSKRRTKTKNFF